jgi:GTPase SAR1 family protein
MSVKFLLLGDDGVGKRQIGTMKIIGNQRTILFELGDQEETKQIIDNQNVEFTIKVSPKGTSADIKDVLINSDIRGSNVFLLIYSSNDVETFKSLEKYFTQIHEVKQGIEDKDFVIILLGNLRDSTKNVVSKKDLKNLSDSWNCLSLETNEDDRKQIDKIFEIGARKYLKMEIKNEKKECFIM